MAGREQRMERLVYIRCVLLFRGFIAAVGINEGPCFHGGRVAVQISFYYLPRGNLFDNDPTPAGCGGRRRCLAANEREWSLSHSAGTDGTTFDIVRPEETTDIPSFYHVAMLLNFNVTDFDVSRWYDVQASFNAASSSLFRLSFSLCETLPIDNV